MPDYMHNLTLAAIREDVEDMDVVPSDRVRVEEEPDFEVPGVALHWDEEFEASGTLARDWWVYPVYVTLIQARQAGRGASILPVAKFRQICRRTWHNKRISGLTSDLAAGNCHIVAQVKPHSIYVPARYRANRHVTSMLVLATFAEHRVVES